LLVLLSLCLGYQTVLHGCPFLNCILLHRAASYDVCVSLNTTRCPDCKKKTTAQVPEEDSTCGRPHYTSSVVCKHTSSRLGDFAFIIPTPHARVQEPVAWLAASRGASSPRGGNHGPILSPQRGATQRPDLIYIPCDKTHQHVRGPRFCPVRTAAASVMHMSL
jgi:hypothetical protein